MTTATIGFIGTGLMGSGMARALLRRGHRVRLFNRTRAKAEAVVASMAGMLASPTVAVKGSGIVVESPADAARGADVVVTMVADPGALRAVTESERGVLAGIGRGAVLIDASTVSPAATLALKEKLGARGAEMLDTPVFGSRDEAEAGALGLLVGGEAEVIERVRPVLEALGRVHHVGANGMGAWAKLAVNLAIAGALQACNEGLVVATKAGLDPEVMLRVLLSSRARSGVVEMKAPRVLERDFTAYFPLALMAKDLRLVREAAAGMGVALPVADALSEWYAGCVGAGLGAEDYCAAIKPLEARAGVEVGVRGDVVARSATGL